MLAPRGSGWQPDHGGDGRPRKVCAVEQGLAALDPDLLDILVDAHPSRLPETLAKLPEGMPLDLAALLGCAVLTGVGAATEAAKVQPGNTVEVIGVPAAQKQAFQMLRRRGKLVLVGLAPVGSSLDVSSVIIVAREVQVIGSLMGSAPFQLAIPAYAQLYLDGKLQLAPLVSQRIHLEDINRGYEQLIAGETARSVIVFDN